jgi:hypothetical protein
MKGMTRITQLMRIFHLKRIFALYRRAQELRTQCERQDALHDKYNMLPGANYPPICMFYIIFNLIILIITFCNAARISEKWEEVQRYPLVGRTKKQRGIDN